MKFQKNRLAKIFAPLLLLIGLQVSLPNAAHAAAFTISASSGTASVGTYYAGYTVTSSNFGGGTNYTIDQSAALTTSGLTFNAIDGTLSGIPAATLAATMFTITEFSFLFGFQTQTFTLTINAATTPIFNLSSSSEVATAGTAITGYTIASLGTHITGYSIAPTVGNGLSFDTSTGLLSGTPLAAQSLITYTITATDGVNTAFQGFDLTVNAAVPTTPAFTLSSVSESAFVGSPIVGYNINSTGDAITSFSIGPSVAGTGLSFSTITGLLSGTPSNTGAGNSYSITAHDAGGHTAMQNFILLVSTPLPTTPAFTLSHSTESVTVGSPVVGYTINSTGDLITGYAVSPALPLAPAVTNGLSFDPSTGLISGTPTLAATGIYTITASDAGAHTAIQTYSLTVNSATPPLTIYPKQTDSVLSLAPSELPANKSVLLAISGNFPVPLTAIYLNNQPLALNDHSQINESTYLVTIPAQQPNSLAILDFYDGQAPLIKSWILSVQAATTLPLPIIKIISPVAPQILKGAVGVKFSEAIKATSTTYAGGVDPVAYSITSGVLPDGLKLNDDGTITGTPTSSGVSTLTAGVTDSTDPSVSAEVKFEIDISAPLALTATQSGVVIPEKKVIEVIGDQTVDPIQLATTGAIGDATITFDPSTPVPDWISFNVDSNTLDVNNEFGNLNSSSTILSITFIATDSANSPQTAKVTLNFELIPLLSQPISLGLEFATPGEHISIDLSDEFQGGKAPITFAVTSGKLPEGITLSNSGTLSGTIKSAGDYKFTITATDSAEPSQTISSDYYVVSFKPINS